MGLVCITGKTVMAENFRLKAVNTRTNIIIFVPCRRFLFLRENFWTVLFLLRGRSIINGVWGSDFLSSETEKT